MVSRAATLLDCGLLCSVEKLVFADSRLALGCVAQALRPTLRASRVGIIKWLRIMFIL
ncbi:hypothetical protein D3C77_760840 [compost metagenome]